MKYIQILFFALLPVLALVSCDYNADKLEYEDIIGMYRGDGEALVTVNVKGGITLEDGRHLNYGDTLMPTVKAPDPLEMGIMVNTDGRMMFYTSVPKIHVLGREFSIDYIGVDELPVEIKGNHIISWGISELQTQSIILPVETVYIPVNKIDILYTENGHDNIITGKGYVAVSISNYTIHLDLMVVEAPGLLTEGCALWMNYKGVMYSKETHKEKFQ